MSHMLDYVLHIDHYLMQFSLTYGKWGYLLLCLVIFCETGCLLTVFLPGDSLLFVAGTLAAVPQPALNIHLLFLFLVAAAILGNAVNYLLGCLLGPSISVMCNRFLRPYYLTHARLFYERHGGKAIVLARFLPIVRTFVPFVAGISSMQIIPFVAYSIAGGIIWVGGLLSAGYFFGQLPFIQQNLLWIIGGIVVFSICLPLVSIFYHRVAVLVQRNKS